MRKSSTFLSVFVLFVIINMILSPSLYIEQALNGISAWAFHVLPSVLPFIFFTKVLINLGKMDKLSSISGKFTTKLFKTPAISSFVFLSSIVSGYPIGAKMTADLYQNGEISKSDAFKMCSFCSTSGPMFIVGAVGAGMLGNVQYGYLILIAHILGAILNGLVYRNLKVKNNENISKEISTIKPSQNDLSSIVLDSVLSIISVGAIICIFFVIITSLNPIFSIFPPQLASLFKGIVEITKGCTEIAIHFKGILSIIACTFIISFGGISTILQTITLLNKLHMPTSLFVLQKFTHAIFSTIISILIVLFI